MEELRDSQEQLDRQVALRGADRTRTDADLQRVQQEGAAQLERITLLAAAELEGRGDRLPV